MRHISIRRDGDTCIFQIRVTMDVLISRGLGLWRLVSRLTVHCAYLPRPGDMVIVYVGDPLWECEASATRPG